MQGMEEFAPIEYVDENHFDELFNMLVKGSFSPFSRYCH
jgi:hypothetical protein